MAMIECSECKAQISSKAAACPQCGNPNVAHSEATKTEIIPKSEWLQDITGEPCGPLESARSIENIEAVRDSVQLIVDDYYRTAFLYQGQLDLAYLESHQDQFCYKLDRYMLQFPVKDHQFLFEFISQIRKKTENECKYDPINFRKRLGTPRGCVAQSARYQRQGLGELALRTAVRATVWETIFSIFRR